MREWPEHGTQARLHLASLLTGIFRQSVETLGFPNAPSPA